MQKKSEFRFASWEAEAFVWLVILVGFSSNLPDFKEVPTKYMLTCQKKLGKVVYMIYMSWNYIYIYIKGRLCILQISHADSCAYNTQITRFPHSLFVCRTCRFWNSSAERAGCGRQLQQRLVPLGSTSTMEIPQMVTQMHSISWVFLELRGVPSAMIWYAQI